MPPYSNPFLIFGFLFLIFIFLQLAQSTCQKITFLQRKFSKPDFGLNRSFTNNYIVVHTSNYNTFFSPKQYPNSTSFANWISNANVEIRIQNVIMISTCASANLDTSPNPIQRDSIGALVSSISYYQKYIRIHLCISIKGLYLHIENFPPRLLYYHLPPTSENHKSFFSHLEPNKSQKVLDTSIGSHVDYTTLGIMAGLALMFIVICVVLQLFAK